MITIIRRVLQSVSFLPSFLAGMFGLLAVLSLLLPTAEVDNPIERVFAITDEESIENIFGFIIGGIFTLTVFSYTMVMNVLNRSISNYSPRLLPLILVQKYHQSVLGFTSGTIMYSLIMLLFLNNEDSRQFPVYATSIGIFFSIVCVILFIYFIHSVSQGIHVNHLLRKSYEQTRKAQVEFYNRKNFEETSSKTLLPFEIRSKECGYLDEPPWDKLLAKCEELKITVGLKPLLGSFVYENDVLFETDKELSDRQKSQLINLISVDQGEPLKVHETGYKHLSEVAVKACSPAINDPGTSLTAIDYLIQLFMLRLQQPHYQALATDQGQAFYFCRPPNDDLLQVCVQEMWVYMKDDPVLVAKLREVLLRSQTVKSEVNYHTALFQEILSKPTPVFS